MLNPNVFLISYFRCSAQICHKHTCVTLPFMIEGIFEFGSIPPLFNFCPTNIALQKRFLPLHNKKTKKKKKKKQTLRSKMQE